MYVCSHIQYPYVEVLQSLTCMVKSKFDLYWTRGSNPLSCNHVDPYVDTKAGQPWGGSSLMRGLKECRT